MTIPTINPQHAPVFDDQLRELQIISYIVLCNNAVSDRYMENRFGMPVQAWSGLLAISIYPGIRAKEIRAIIPRPQNTISRAVALLESRQLIEQRASLDDAREKLLYITEGGAHLLKEIREVSLRRQDEMFGSLNDEERETFCRLANKIAHGKFLSTSEVMRDEREPSSNP